MCIRDRIKHIYWCLILELRLHCCKNLIMNLLAILVQEYFTLILRVLWILDDLDVAVVR